MKNLNNILLILVISVGTLEARFWKTDDINPSEKEYPFYAKKDQILFSKDALHIPVSKFRIPAILRPEGYLLQAKTEIINFKKQSNWIFDILKKEIIREYDEVPLVKIVDPNKYYSPSLGNLVIESKNEFFVCSFCRNDQKKIVILCEKLCCKIIIRGNVYFVGEFEKDGGENTPRELSIENVNTIYAAFAKKLEIKKNK